MNVPVILICDSRERGNRIAESIIEAAREIFEANEFPEIFIYQTDLRQYNFYSNNWKKRKKDLLHDVTIRLRHQNDKWPGMPTGKMKIDYTADDPYLLNKNIGTYLIRRRILDEENTEFTIEMAKELLNYIKFGSLPSFLISDTFNANLENRLEENYKLLKENNNINLKEFAPGLINKLLSSTNGKILIIWPGNVENEEKFLNSFDSEYIHNLDYSINVVNNKNYLHSITNFSNYDLIILPAEIIWESTDKYTDYFGFQELSNLRRSSFAGVAFLATMDPIALNNFLDSKENRAEVFNVFNTGYNFIWDISGKVTTSNHNFEKLKTVQNIELEIIINNNKTKMSTRRMEDVRNYLLPKGRLSAIFHEFKRKTIITKDKSELIKEIELAFNDIKYLIPLTNQDNYTIFKVDEIKKILNQDRISECRNLFLSSQNIIKGYLPKDDTSVLEFDDKIKFFPWRVLLLEDDKDTAIVIKNVLKSRGIHSTHVLKSEDALALLEKDWDGLMDAFAIAGSTENSEGEIPKLPNSINIVIADVRLESDNRWDVIQGYDFVELLSKRPNIVSVIMLTQKESVILQASAEFKRLNSIWFSKELLQNSNTQEFLLNKIIELGNESYETLCSLPKSTVWTTTGYGIHDYPLSFCYKQYRENVLYKNLEQDINETAINFLNLWLAKKVKDNNKIEDYKKAVEKTFPMSYIKFNLSINRKQNKNSITINQLFCVKLVGRRTSLLIRNHFYLHKNRFNQMIFGDGIVLVKQLPQEIAILLLNYNKVKIDDSVDDLIVRDLFNKHLGLNIGDIENWNKNILVEERLFLNKYANSDLYDPKIKQLEQEIKILKTKLQSKSN